MPRKLTLAACGLAVAALVFFTSTPGELIQDLWASIGMAGAFLAGRAWERRRKR